MRKVLLISRHFPPAAGPGVHRPYGLVRYLKRYGYQPVVLTGEPDSRHPEDLSIAGGAENIEKVCVSPGRICRALLRIPQVHYLMRPDEHIFWAISTALKASEMIRRRQIDLIYTTSPPYSVNLAGLLLKEMTRIPWLLEFRDLWSANPGRYWRTFLHYKVDEILESLCVRAADGLLTITNGQREFLLKRFGLPREKVHWIPSGFHQILPAQLRRTSPGIMKICYVGSFCWRPDLIRARRSRFLYRPEPVDLTTHSPLYLFRALRLAMQKEPGLRGSIRITLAGWRMDRYKDLACENGLEKVVELLDYVSHEEALKLIGESDLLFLCLACPQGNPPPASSWVPGKLYEYFSAGKPVLGLVPEGDTKELLERSGLGVCPAPRDVDKIAREIIRLFREHRSGGIKVHPKWDFIRRFEWPRLSEALARVFDGILRRSDSR